MVIFTVAASFSIPPFCCRIYNLNPLHVVHDIYRLQSSVQARLNN